MKEFYIVDLHGNLLHKVVPDLSDDATITGFFWTDFGLIYRVDDHFDSLHNEFRLVDPDQPEIYETILRSVDQYKIIGVNENTENMLLYSYDGVTENDTSKFFQYDISTGTFGTEILLEGDLVRSSYSLGDGAYIGLGLRDNNINTTFLWVYDWQTGEFTKHIQIIDLLGWREDLEGFSVATRNDFGNYEIRIIRP